MPDREETETDCHPAAQRVIGAVGAGDHEIDVSLRRATEECQLFSGW
jgi:hypothetical protein